MTTEGETVPDRQVIEDALDEVEREMYTAKDVERASLQVARAVLLLARLFTPKHTL